MKNTNNKKQETKVEQNVKKQEVKVESNQKKENVKNVNKSKFKKIRNGVVLVAITGVLIFAGTKAASNDASANLKTEKQDPNLDDSKEKNTTDVTTKSMDTTDVNDVAEIGDVNYYDAQEDYETSTDIIDIYEEENTDTYSSTDNTDTYEETTETNDEVKEDNDSIDEKNSEQTNDVTYPSINDQIDEFVKYGKEQGLNNDEIISILIGMNTNLRDYDITDEIQFSGSTFKIRNLVENIEQTQATISNFEGFKTETPGKGCRFDLSKAVIVVNEETMIQREVLKELNNREINFISNPTIENYIDVRDSARFASTAPVKYTDSEGNKKEGRLSFTQAEIAGRIITEVTYKYAINQTTLNNTSNKKHFEDSKMISRESGLTIGKDYVVGSCDEDIYDGIQKVLK